MIPLVKTDTLASETLDLADGEVHVWHVNLGHSSTLLQPLHQTLSPDECARASRFRFDRDKNHFIAARGLLREILSHYLGTMPEEITFIYNAQGKPALRNDTYQKNLRFNVSHSHGTAIYAITPGKNIGIDIEQIRNIEHNKIAQRFFSRQEVAVLQSLPKELMPRGFYNCWTRKEAYLKARGEGLMKPLDQFSVSLSPEEPASLINCQWDPDEPPRWSLHELDVGHNYVAAMAVAGTPTKITCRSWHT